MTLQVVTLLPGITSLSQLRCHLPWWHLPWSSQFINPLLQASWITFIYFHLYTDICWFSQLDHEFLLGKNYVYLTHPQTPSTMPKKKYFTNWYWIEISKFTERDGGRGWHQAHLFLETTTPDSYQWNPHRLIILNHKTVTPSYRQACEG